MFISASLLLGLGWGSKRQKIKMKKKAQHNMLVETRERESQMKHIH